jgi:hypothetical protein
MPKYGHWWVGQAKPSVFTRFGAPRRLLTSRQGRTGGAGGSTPDARVEERRQAGQSRGERGDAEVGGLRSATPLLSSEETNDGSSTDDKAVPSRGHNIFSYSFPPLGMVQTNVTH